MPVCRMGIHAGAITSEIQDNRPMPAFCGKSTFKMRPGSGNILLKY